MNSLCSICRLSQIHFELQFRNDCLRQDPSSKLRRSLSLSLDRLRSTENITYFNITSSSIDLSFVYVFFILLLCHFTTSHRDRRGQCIEQWRFVGQWPEFHASKGLDSSTNSYVMSTWEIFSKKQNSFFSFTYCMINLLLNLDSKVGLLNLWPQFWWEIKIILRRFSEIWQPWCTNFGNLENQTADLHVFEDP